MHGEREVVREDVKPCWSSLVLSLPLANSSLKVWDVIESSMILLFEQFFLFDFIAQLNSIQTVLFDFCLGRCNDSEFLLLPRISKQTNK